MWSPLGSANTLLCTPAHGGRAGHPGDRTPVLVRRDGPPRPAPPRAGRGAVDAHQGPPLARHRPDGAPSSACVPPAWPRRAPAAIVTAADPVGALHPWGRRGPAGPVASESPDVGPAHEPGAARAGRRGAWCRRADPAAAQRRSAAGGPAPGGRSVARRPTLAPQSRAGLAPQTHRRAPLLPQALPPPAGARGCGDDVWWRRLAQPHPQAGTAAAAPAPGPARPRPPDEPAPKALACSGRLVRAGPQPGAQRGRRLGAGRPGRAVPRAGLAWGAAPRAAHGGTAWRWSGDQASGQRRHAGRRGRRHHQREGQQGAVGGRVVGCPWPRQSPGRNPSAPQWVPGKRAVA